MIREKKTPFLARYICNVFALLSFFVLCNTSKAQEKTTVELLNSNTLEFDKHLNENIQRLIGNVIFKLDSTYMYCDSAYHYTDIERIDAFSNVHIKQGDTLHIYGDTAVFNGVTNIAEIRGKVEMIDNEIVLTTRHLDYNINTEIASYYDGGKIVDTRNQLTSVFGEYHSNKKEFFFKNDVVFTNPNYVMNSDTLKYNTDTEIAYFYGPTTIQNEENFIYCENGWNDSKSDISQFNRNAYYVDKKDGRRLQGDSLYYNRTAGLGKAFNNVFITDTVQNIIISGDFGRYTENDNISFVTGKAMLTQFEDGDSLFMHADTLKAISDSIESKRVLFAFHKVKFYRQDLQGMCDSLVYSFGDSTIKMFYKPVLWSDENQLSADTIYIYTGNNEIQSIYLTNIAFIISKDDTAKYNQIKGDRITGYFKDNDLYKLHVQSKSQTIYYARDDYDHLIGVNTSLSDEVLIFIEDSKIYSITYIKNPEAIMYPIAELPQEKKILKDFKWLIQHRPLKKEDIFIPYLPPAVEKRGRRD